MSSALAVAAFLLAVTVALVAVMLRRWWRSGHHDDGQPGWDEGMELTPEQWIGLGTIFAGAGAALMTTVGPAMIGMTALGVVYLAIGLSKRRQGPDGT